MSMHIKFKDDYNEATTYYGELDDEYEFTVVVMYYSNSKLWVIDSIEWLEEPEKDMYKRGAEDKITEVVMNWHKGRCFPKQDFITGRDPGDENE